MVFLFVFLLLLPSFGYTDDFSVTLNKGECALIGERVLCWEYHPSYLHRADEPPMACELGPNKNCPVTYLLPNSEIHRNVTRVDTGASITNLCKTKRVGGETHSRLVQIIIPPADGRKREVVLEDFGDRAGVCKEYEKKFIANHRPGDGVVILDAYKKPKSCPNLSKRKLRRRHRL